MQRLKNMPDIGFKGINDSDKPEFLKDGYVTLVEDGRIVDNEIVKGPGAALLFGTNSQRQILGGIATASEIYVAINEPGDNYAFIYRYTGSGNPVVVSGANLLINTPVEFVDTGTAVYVLNGSDATGKLVGATYSTPAGLPIGKYGAWFNNRFYITGNSTFKSRLYYSDANTPETFGGSSYIDVFPNFQSDNTSLASIGGVLMVGKKNNIITFDGFTEDDFTVKQLTETMPNFGVSSHRSIVNTGDDLLFMSFGGGTPHIRSLKKTSFDKINYGGTITEAIEGTMKTVNKNRLNQVCGGFDGRYAYWSMPLETSTVNNYTIQYDTFEKEVVGFHNGINASVYFRSTLTGDDRLYFGSARSLGRVYSILDSLGSREDESMMFKVVSRRYRPATNRKAKFKYLYLTTGEDTNTDVTVSTSPDGYTYEEQDVIAPLVNGSVFPMTFPFKFGVSEDKKHRIDLKGTTTAYAYQVMIEEEETEGNAQVFPFTFPITFGQDSSLVIKEWDLLYYPRGLRDA